MAQAQNASNAIANHRSRGVTTKLDDLKVFHPKSLNQIKTNIFLNLTINRVCLTVLIRMCSSLEIRMLCSQLEFLCQNQDQLSQFLKCDLRFKLLCSNFDCVVKKDKEFNLKEQTEKEEQEEVTQGHEDREKEVDSALLVRLSLQLISTLVQQIHQESLDESGTQLFILLTACVARFGSVNDFQLLINQSFENQSIPAKVSTIKFN